MFKISKYSKWYHSIVHHAQAANRVKGEGIYYEDHHIIPRSLAGSDDSTNITRLTAREHFLCHLLLTKMMLTKDNQIRMACAFMRFRDHSNSRMFERFKSSMVHLFRGENNHSYGRKWCYDVETEEIKYLLPEEFDRLPLGVYQLGLPYQQGGFKGYKWINNGTRHKMIPRDDLLEFGWNEGRLNPKTADQMSELSKKRHTKENDDRHRRQMLNRVAIVKDGTTMKIKPTKLLEYQENGWEIYELKRIPKQFFRFEFSDGSTKVFKNYRAFCKEYQLDYTVCKNRGYDRYVKSVVPDIIHIVKFHDMIQANPRKNGF
jgi:hypothetical protein